MNTSQLVCTCLRLSSRSILSPSPSATLALAASASRRSLHAQASVPKESRIPVPRGSITTTHALLAASKRKLEQYESKLGEWSELFTKTGAELRDTGMTVTERRYLLWLLEKYRRGHDIAAIAIAETPKKKVRGWGPKVQNGKRVR